MSLEGEKMDTLVQLEKWRFQADEEKVKRMAKRADDILIETSEVKKTLMKARQFLDEFS